MADVLRFTSVKRRGGREGRAAATATVEAIDSGYEFVSLLDREGDRYARLIDDAVQERLTDHFGTNIGACNARITLRSVEPEPTGDEWIADIGRSIAERILAMRWPSP